MSESDWCTCQLRCLFFTYGTSTPISESDDKTLPFQRFARSEGEILYSRTTEKIKPWPYGRLHDTARQLYDFFFRQGVNLLAAACDRFGENDLRLTLFFTSHAAELLLQALHGAYYASESKARSLPELFRQTRTLSAKLSLLLDPDTSDASRIFSRLEKSRQPAFSPRSCDCSANETADYLDRMSSLKQIVEECGERRPALYAARRASK